jgi:hypothetical protein
MTNKRDQLDKCKTCEDNNSGWCKHVKTNILDEKIDNCKFNKPKIKVTVEASVALAQMLEDHLIEVRKIIEEFTRETKGVDIYK